MSGHFCRKTCAAYLYAETNERALQTVVGRQTSQRTILDAIRPVLHNDLHTVSHNVQELQAAWQIIETTLSADDRDNSVSHLCAMCEMCDNTPFLMGTVAL